MLRQFKFEKSMNVNTRDGIEPRKMRGFVDSKNMKKFMKYTTIENEKLTGFTESYYQADEEFDLSDWFIIDSEGARYRIWKFLIVIL